MTKPPTRYANCRKPKDDSFQRSTVNNKVYVKAFIGIITLIICFLQFSCNHSLHLPKGEVIVLDTRNSKEPDENLTSHKQYDVEVYRSFYPIENGYSVRYYQKENKILKSHMATYGAKDDFDRASYSWVNDTSVLIRLYSTTSNKEKKFTAYGYGPTSGMKINK